VHRLNKPEVPCWRRAAVVVEPGISLDPLHCTGHHGFRVQTSRPPFNKHLASSRPTYCGCTYRASPFGGTTAEATFSRLLTARDAPAGGVLLLPTERARHDLVPGPNWSIPRSFMARCPRPDGAIKLVDKSLDPPHGAVRPGSESATAGTFSGHVEPKRLKLNRRDFAARNRSWMAAGLTRCGLFFILPGLAPWSRAPQPREWQPCDLSGH